MIEILAGLLLQGAAVAAEAPAAPEAPIACAGEHRQGAALICRTAPGAEVSLGDVAVTADENGWVVLGHDRDAEAETTLRVASGDEVVYEETVSVAQREYDIQRIDGVPPEYVTPPPETLERIRREGAVKSEAYTSQWSGRGFLDGFAMPADGPITGVYGSQRVYNGEPRRPHYGLDVAAADGTPVHAPASGIVTLADDDMYFEGGLIFIDHGQGFTSAFLHLGAVDVAVGDVVEQGQKIGEIGSGGRSTGAHVDWRIKWRGRYIDPATTLDLQLSAPR
ncbi:peptidase M23 [Marinicauda salina]|uniref:Peptidase M23 n=1 Tax=Marinicauda salina TaxID=2135793 RepID=A0A2U2BUI4_9PROT|nr:M23 family metallopeptidase [Marinicauda salina]PWE17696.1 peptidase M23 [Marinicauda salina]